jgi:hypothetical protein
MDLVRATAEPLDTPNRVKRYEVRHWPHPKPRNLRRLSQAGLLDPGGPSP